MLEILTVLIVMGVLVAIAIPAWRTHELRTRRLYAIGALLMVQKNQDLYFGEHARYSGSAEKPPPDNRFYRIELRVSGDALAYTATARAREPAVDSRCVEFSIDHNGLRRAVDAAGEDRSADCWR